VASQRAFLDSEEQLQRTLRDHFPPTVPFSKAQEFFDSSDNDKAGATLNAAMTAHDGAGGEELSGHALERAVVAETRGNGLVQPG
jgi:hypothetical protein